MTGEELDKVYELAEEIETEIVNLVNQKLQSAGYEVSDLVRTKLQEEFRFWRVQ
jgi:hypothetical protein